MVKQENTRPSWPGKTWSTKTLKSSSSCPVVGTHTEAEKTYYLTSRAEWKSLRAVRNKRVFLADGNQYFNRPGPRVVESLEIIAQIIYPKIFQKKNKLSLMESDWETFEGVKIAGAMCAIPGARDSSEHPEDFLNYSTRTIRRTRRDRTTPRTHTFRNSHTCSSIMVFRPFTCRYHCPITPWPLSPTSTRCRTSPRDRRRAAP